MSRHELALRSAAVEAQEQALTPLERLYESWQEAKALQRRGKALEDQLRPEVEEALSEGSLVGTKDAYLAYEESASVECDLEALVEDLGVKIALRIVDVSSRRLRELTDAGVIPKGAPYLSTKTTKRLVTKTARQSQ